MSRFSARLINCISHYEKINIIFLFVYRIIRSKLCIPNMFIYTNKTINMFVYVYAVHAKYLILYNRLSYCLVQRWQSWSSIALYSLLSKYIVAIYVVSKPSN